MKLIVDADTWIVKLAYLNEGKTKSDVYVNVINYIESQLREFNVSNDYLLVLAGKGNFRYDIYPLYKAKREKPEFEHFNYIKEDIVKTNFKWLSVNGVESDDVIASYKYKYNDIIIMHDDKDLLQIPGLHIYRGKYLTIDELEAVRFLYKQILTGDSTDNIQGVPGIGPVNADKLLNNQSIINLFDIVLNEYKRYYNDTYLIEFYKNYQLLKLKHDVEI